MLGRVSGGVILGLLVAIVPSVAQVSGQTTPDFWVDAANGDDASYCRLQALPCRTIQAAVDQIPARISADLTIHVAAGEYAEEVVLADRSSHNGSTVRILGEPGAVLVGGSGRAIGIQARRIPGLLIENLEIREFEEAAVSLMYTESVRIVAARLVDNAGHGLMMRLSRAEVENSVFERNGDQGIRCHTGWLTLGSDSAPGPIAISDNARDGLYAASCHVAFDGAAWIFGNEYGVRSAHGAEIDLENRQDVSLWDNRLDDLKADCHGMIANYTLAGCGAPCPRPLPSPFNPGLGADPGETGPMGGRVPLIETQDCRRTCACVEEYYGVCTN